MASHHRRQPPLSSKRLTETMVVPGSAPASHFTSSSARSGPLKRVVVVALASACHDARRKIDPRIVEAESRDRRRDQFADHVRFGGEGRGGCSIVIGPGFKGRRG